MKEKNDTRKNFEAQENVTINPPTQEYQSFNKLPSSQIDIAPIVSKETASSKKVSKQSTQDKFTSETPYFENPLNGQAPVQGGLTLSAQLGTFEENPKKSGRGVKKDVRSAYEPDSDQIDSQDLLAFEESRKKEGYDEQYKRILEENENLRKRNDFFRAEVKKYQTELQQRDLYSEDQARENEFLKAELERYRQGSRKGSSTSEQLLKENESIKTVLANYQETIADLTSENQRLNDNLEMKIKEFEDYKRGFDRPIGNPSLNFDGTTQSPIERTNRASKADSSLERSPESQNRLYQGVGTSENVIPSKPTFVQSGLYSSNVNNQNIGTKKKIFERVQYEKPRMILTPEDYS